MGRSGKLRQIYILQILYHRTDETHCLKQGYNSPESGQKSHKTLINQRKTAPMALRDQEAAGSNPVTPMSQKPLKSLRFRGFSLFASLETCGGMTAGSVTVGEDPCIGSQILMRC